MLVTCRELTTHEVSSSFRPYVSWYYCANPTTKQISHICDSEAKERNIPRNQITSILANGSVWAVPRAPRLLAE